MDTRTGNRPHTGGRPQTRTRATGRETGTRRRRRKNTDGRGLLLAVVLVAVLLIWHPWTAPGPAALPEETPPATTEPETTPPTELDLTAASAQEIIADAAEKQGIPQAAWPRSLVELLERNRETLDFVLNYPEMYGKEQEFQVPEVGNMDTVPLFMQWDPRWGYRIYGTDVAGITACGPTALAMVTCYFTGDPTYNPAYMMEFAEDNGYCVPGNGTAWALISEGGEMLGLDVTEIPLDESRVLENLEAGNPIICIMGPGDFTTSGHYIVMVGTEDGKIRINDSNSRERSEKLWEFDKISDQIDNLWVIRSGQ